MFKITRSELGHLGAASTYEKAQKIVKADEHRKEVEKERTQQYMTVGGAGVTAAGLGYMKGKMGGMVSVVGIPADAIVALAGVGSVLAGWVPMKYEGLAMGAGIAGLCSFADWQGAKFGQQSRKDAGNMGKPLDKNVQSRTVTAGASAFDQRFAQR